MLGGNVDVAAADLVTITDFEAGLGGDVLAFDASLLAATIVAGISASATSIAIGTIAQLTSSAGIGAANAFDNTIIVVTGGVGYATDLAALAAINDGAVGGGDSQEDIILVYFNTGSGYAHVVADDDSAGAGSVHVASLTGITTVAGMAEFTVANFDAY